MLKNGLQTYNFPSIGYSLRALWRDVGQLIKFRLSSLVVFSSVLAYLIALPKGHSFSFWNLCVLAIGGFAVTGASNALNQVLEVDFDKKMIRTSDRPLVTERRSIVFAVLLAGILAFLGLLALAVFNLFTAYLGALAFVLYVFVYTPLKRVGPIAVFVGSIPGALPMTIGCVAALGEIDILAFFLFAVQFLWQFPHFMSIGVLSFEDYQNAGFKLIHVNNGAPHQSTGRDAFYPSITLFAVIIWACYANIIVFPTALILCLGTVLLSYQAWIFKLNMNKESAKRLLYASLLYLPYVLIVLLIQKTFI